MTRPVHDDQLEDVRSSPACVRSIQRRATAHRHPRLSSAAMVIAIDGPVGGRQVNRCACARAERSASPTSTSGAMYRYGRVDGRRARSAAPAEVARAIADRATANASARSTARDVTAAIRDAERSQEAASQVAADPDVRAALSRSSSAQLTREGNWVAEGRDIGTVVAPGRGRSRSS